MDTPVPRKMVFRLRQAPGRLKEIWYSIYGHIKKGIIINTKLELLKQYCI